MSEEDVLYGSLFKLPFFKPSSGRRTSLSWSKHFFAFNQKNLLLQYWGSEVERTFKSEGCVNGRPKGTILLMSATLRVEAGDVERSMFGQKYPIAITGGPGFEGKTLQLATNSVQQREKWVDTIKGAVVKFKERQRMVIASYRMIKDKDHFGYDSIENQHRLLTFNESELNNLDDDIRRAQVQIKLMNNKDKLLYDHQEKLRIAHREAEDKLYSMTLQENNHKRKFKFIATNLDGVVTKSYPLYLKPGTKHWKDLESDESDGRMGRVKELLKKDHPINDLTDEDIHPYFNENVIMAQSGKEFDASEKVDRGPQQMRLKLMEKEMKQHEVRKLSVIDDPDLKSLAEMNVWDMLLVDDNRRSELNHHMKIVHDGESAKDPYRDVKNKAQRVRAEKNYLRTFKKIGDALVDERISLGEAWEATDSIEPRF